MYIVEHSLLRLRITHLETSIQFTYQNDGVTLEWLNAYRLWDDWKPEGVAHHHLRYALSVLRGFIPLIHTVSVRDSTAFLCPTPGGDFLVPLAPFYLCFYGKTWYEYCADATAKTDHDDYVMLRSQQFDQAFKLSYSPQWFNFSNSSLINILYPIYRSAPTWHDFFHTIALYYPNTMCGMLYPYIHYHTADVLKGWIGGWTWVIPLAIEPLHVTSLYTSDLCAAPCIEYECTQLSPHMSLVQQWDYTAWITQK